MARKVALSVTLSPDRLERLERFCDRCGVPKGRSSRIDWAINEFIIEREGKRDKAARKEADRALTVMLGEI